MGIEMLDSSKDASATKGSTSEDIAAVMKEDMSRGGTSGCVSRKPTLGQLEDKRDMSPRADTVYKAYFGIWGKDDE